MGGDRGFPALFSREGRSEFLRMLEDEFTEMPFAKVWKAKVEADRRLPSLLEGRDRMRKAESYSPPGQVGFKRPACLVWPAEAGKKFLDPFDVWETFSRGGVLPLPFASSGIFGVQVGAVGTDGADVRSLRVILSDDKGRRFAR